MAMTMRREIEVRVVEQTPLDVCLDLWLRWIRRSDLDVGWRGRSVGLDSDACADSEQLYDRMDTQVGLAMDAMIGGLSLQQQWAIKRRCGVATAWRFPQLVFADVLIVAEDNLIHAMKKNLATWSFFK